MMRARRNNFHNCSYFPADGRTLALGATPKRLSAFRASDCWVIIYNPVAGIHRIGQHDHMKPCHRHKLPEIDAHFKVLFPSGRPPAPVRKDGPTAPPSPRQKPPSAFRV
jgi:hypothetical protein